MLRDVISQSILLVSVVTGGDNSSKIDFFRIAVPERNRSTHGHQSQCHDHSTPHPT